MRSRELDDAGYFRERAIEEQVAAQRATCAAARQRHDEMAALYRFRAIFASGGSPAVSAREIAKSLTTQRPRIREAAL